MGSAAEYDNVYWLVQVGVRQSIYIICKEPQIQMSENKSHIKDKHHLHVNIPDSDGSIQALELGPRVPQLGALHRESASLETISTADDQKK